VAELYANINNKDRAKRSEGATSGGVHTAQEERREMRTKRVARRPDIQKR
jgi:hypothetical protein